jgi:cytochrome c
VEVVDAQKAAAKGNVVEVYAGNAQPVVTIDMSGNRSFYFPNKPVSYTVKVSDPGAKVDPKNLFVSTDFIQGKDLASASVGHQVISEAILGKNIMMNSDCKACHSITGKSIGPAYADVAKKYQQDTRAHEYLASKILKGGSGVWGENTMPAHLTMPESDARQIVTWILSLANAESAKSSLPASGKISPQPNEEKKQDNVFRLMATYTDNGSAGISPLSGSGSVYLRNNVMDVSDFRSINGLSKKDSLGATYLVLPASQAWIKGEQLDLTGISRIEIAGSGNGRPGKYTVELRTGQPNGPLLGQAALQFGADRQRASASMPLPKTAGNGQLQDLYFVIRQQGTGGRAYLKSIAFMPE